MNKMTNDQVVELLSITYDGWVGCLGYDNIPYKAKTRELIKGVSVEVGFADGRESYITDLDTVLIKEFVVSAEIGETIILPKYYGCNYEGDDQLTKMDSNLWVYLQQEEYENE